MTAFEIANLAIASAAVAVVAAVVAAVGANDERGQQQRAATQQREAEECRHEENMTALEAPIAGFERQTAAL